MERAHEQQCRDTLASWFAPKHRHWPSRACLCIAIRGCPSWVAVFAMWGMPTTREMHVLSHLLSPNLRVDGTSSALVLSPSLRTTLVLCVCACVTGNSHVFINIIIIVIMLVFFNRHHLQAATVSATTAVSQVRPYNPICSLCALQDVRESLGR